MGEMVTDAGWLKSGFEKWSNWNLRKDKKRTRLGMRRMGRPLRLLKLLQVYHFTESSKVCELEYFELSSSAVTSPKKQSQH